MDSNAANVNIWEPCKRLTLGNKPNEVFSQLFQLISFLYFRYLMGIVDIIAFVNLLPGWHVQ